jgi:nucleotide-binding universal stress UspA family protein
VVNPFSSESEAYRFLLLTVGYFAAIVLAALVLGRWAGLTVFIVLTLIAFYLAVRRGEAGPPVQESMRRRGAEDERRILVIANETVGGEALREEIKSRAEGYREEVLVVCPALNAPLRHWVSDEDGARRAARERLNDSLARLAEAGVEARGEVGDGDPLQAMEDALRTFGADEVIISTHPEGRSHWLERGVVSGARERFDVPITHIVTDLEAEREPAEREPAP